MSTNKRPLCLLALDGGGVRGLSELYILNGMMLRIQQRENLPAPPKPCELFDLICGTSTGGLIALMLGRLRMSVKEVIAEYCNVAREVFGKPESLTIEARYKATTLERVIQKIVRDYGRPRGKDGKADPNLKLLDEQSSDGCQVFVCTRNTRAMNIVRLLRSYRSYTADEYPDLTVWQAARATSAAPKFFKRLKIGSQGAQEELIDGGLGSNNPTKILIEEVVRRYDSSDQIACIVSVGTGEPRITEFKSPGRFQQTIPFDVVEALKNSTTDCEAIAEEVDKRFSSRPGLYFRFNVNRGLGDIALQEWEELGNTAAETISYLVEYEVTKTIDAVATALTTRDARVAISELRDHMKSSHGREAPLISGGSSRAPVFEAAPDKQEDSPTQSYEHLPPTLSPLLPPSSTHASNQQTARPQLDALSPDKAGGVPGVVAHLLTKPDFPIFLEGSPETIGSTTASRIAPTDSGHASVIPPERLPSLIEWGRHKQSRHDPILGNRITAVQYDSGILAKASDMSRNNSLLDDDETDYSDDYSVETSMEIVQKLASISDIADHLRKCLQQDSSHNDFPGRLFSELPHLLKTFALRLGGSPDASVHGALPIAHFIHKHALLITNDLRQRHLDENEDTNNIRALLPGSISEKQNVLSWLRAAHSQRNKVQVVDYSDGEDDNSVSSDEHNDDTEIDLTTGNQQFLQRLEFVKDTPAYRWLRGALHNLLRMTCPQEVDFPSVKDEIKVYVRRSTPAALSRISESHPPATISAVFYVHWNPFSFLSYPGYDCLQEEALERAITVTGSLSMAQAATVSQYLEQTWPTVGLELLTIVQRLTKDRNRTHRANLSDNTGIILSLVHDILKVEINGIRDAIIEIAEAFAWLGAALRVPSRSTHRSDQTVPEITICKPDVGPLASVTPDLQLKQDKPMIFGRIIFTDQIQGSAEYNGTCWRHMFREKCIARGFPVLARPDEQPGLEMPLNMMTALMLTQHTNVFNNSIYVKGFSSMLVPTQQRKNVLSWHLLYKDDGNRISYLDVDVPLAKNITNETLQTSRHIVGWCSAAKLYAGTQNACHIIDRTDLPPTGGSCLLDRFTLSGGMYVTGGASIIINRREKPFRISRNGQRDKMEWLRQKYVVLWDQAESRGWLVNGTSALLHLTFSSLRRDERSRGSFRFQWERLKDAEFPNTPESAFDILVDQSNLDIELYPNKTEVYREVIETARSKEEVKKTKYTYFLLADRIEELYMFVEKMIDYQTEALNRDGIMLKPSIRKSLEGWEYKDLYCKADPISPCVLKLPAFGDGWVDLVHSLGAITLFGNGFGDLIQPSDSGLCCYWQQLPSEEYYLAACISDLQNMIELFGTGRSDPVRLTREISWRQTPVQKCRCTADQQKHSSVALVLETKCKSKKLLQPGAAVFEGYAAVVLSHRGKVCHSKRRTSNMGDSGLGSSIDSSITAQTPDSQPQEASISSLGPSLIADPNATIPQNSRKRAHSDGEYTPVHKRSLLTIRRLLGSKSQEEEDD